MSNSAENHYDILSPYAPQMPKPLPQMLHLAIKNAPEHMKAAISNSLFPAFGSLMHNVGFRYPDNVFHEPHFMCGLIGPMSIGKGSINPIIETIIQPLRDHDARSNAKLNEWKRQCKTTAANKQRPARPEDAAILAPEPDMTNPACDFLIALVRYVMYSHSQQKNVKCKVYVEAISLCTCPEKCKVLTVRRCDWVIGL